MYFFPASFQKESVITSSIKFLAFQPSVAGRENEGQSIQNKMAELDTYIPMIDVC